ncbi:MAG: substrate-binding domain-containing protein [Oscillospiraceae bacterium]|nr:substrate-binding domain-containing protein [Oscillospiraceae bacterium]
MKKTAIIFGCIIIAIALAFGGHTVYLIITAPEIGLRDQTGDSVYWSESINIMLTRPENWKRIVENPGINWDDMRIIDGSTATVPITAELFRQFFDCDDYYLEGAFYHSTTHSAYINLIGYGYEYEREHEYEDSENEYSDEYEYYFDEPSSRLIFVTPPSDEEIRYAGLAGVELDMDPIAKDGFVFITHKDNPVDSLSVEQIQDIYSGKIANWKDVGGDDLDIKAYQREENSGSQTAMEQLVMQGKEMIPPIETMVIEFMGGLVEAVAEYKNGPSSIGYTYYYYINNLYKNDNIKVLKIDGIEPANDKLASGEYPFSTNYYAVMRGDEPEGSPARLLRDFLISPLGQDVIEMAGYCKAGGLDE